MVSFVFSISFLLKGSSVNGPSLKSHNFRMIDYGILRLKTEREINNLEKSEIYFYNARILYLSA